jgi:2-keto-4-pentenoate hydratase/2-oxohepta-3-ene-1,7-dioic acid hydratase in catechol pathway
LMPEDRYALATYVDASGAPRAGMVVDGRVTDIAGALADSGQKALASRGTTVLNVLGQWLDMHSELRKIARESRTQSTRSKSVALTEVRLLAPILYPGAIFCAGANYRDHVAEMSKALGLPDEPDPHELGLKPWHFIKPAVACVRATGDRIALPTYSTKVDWEAEIAVVIGRACRNVSVERALDYVAGLSIVNDLSARDHIRRAGVPSDSPFHFDWVSQKAFDGALPFGPWICPLDQIGDLSKLGIQLWVNEELMQDSSSSNLIFSMAEQVAHLSTRLTLQPGDVIATGTPAGCGMARGRFLRPGDRVSVRVEHVGTLVNEFTE